LSLTKRSCAVTLLTRTMGTGMHKNRLRDQSRLALEKRNIMRNRLIKSR
jgi:hypothetical protein